MQLFVQTTHCLSKSHCKTCRNKEGGRSWRETLKKVFSLPNDEVDFPCPYGIPWQNSNVMTNVVAPLDKAAQLAKMRATGSRSGGCGCSRKS